MTHQRRPEPFGMLLSVKVANLEAEAELPDAASRAMRLWDRLTGSTADECLTSDRQLNKQQAST